MPKAVRIHEYGGPDVMRFEDVEIGAPGPGEVRVKQHAIGLNYIDVYHRTGLYPMQSLPCVIGTEAAGEVIEIGEGVDDLEVGQRVAYASVIGAYAEERLIVADRLVKLPDAIAYNTAAAMMLQGMTAQYLLRQTYNVGKDTTLLFHAAAGGVGLIACQWANALGATVIGTVSSREKAQLAQEHGCHHAINYREDDFVEKVKEITQGAGVDVVYDSIGKDTFPASLDCLKPRGLFVSFGNASGPVEAFDMGLLAQKGSLFATRPSLMHYIAKSEELRVTAQDVFDNVSAGNFKINVHQTYALQDIAQSHIDLEARKTTGSTILLP
ncbi:MAG: quinone oxidoreductase [Pseudomonadota bacterium]